MKSWEDKNEFKERVHHFAGKLEIQINSLAVRPMKNKWASCSTNGNLNFNAELMDIDFKDEMESIDFGANFGFSFDFTEELFAQARYNLGLANIAKDSDAEKTKNSVISVSLGYKFN